MVELDTRVERVGLAGVWAMVFAHLVWDPGLTAIGIAAFGLAEEDNDLVRRLWRWHPVLWLGLKLLVVGGLAALILRLGTHRDPATAWLPYLIALFGLVGPLGWIELFLAS